jgi:hypothetical protein
MHRLACLALLFTKRHSRAKLRQGWNAILKPTLPARLDG